MFGGYENETLSIIVNCDSFSFIVQVNALVDTQVAPWQMMGDMSEWEIPLDGVTLHALYVRTAGLIWGNTSGRAGWN